jgi:hypothetical protein
MVKAVHAQGCIDVMQLVRAVSAESTKRLRGRKGASCLALEGRLHEVADDFAVDGLAGEFGHDGFHHLAHVFEG